MVVTHGALKESPGAAAASPGGWAVTIGNFDGVHRGHRALLERVVAVGRERKLGSCVEAMSDVQAEGERVSSSAVRAALAGGDLERAARLLGRRYSISGRVAHGEKLGRELGCPTANIVLRRAPPLSGIYVVEAE